MYRQTHCSFSYSRVFNSKLCNFYASLNICFKYCINTGKTGSVATNAALFLDCAATSNG